RERITSSEDAYKIIKPHLMDLKHEEFWVILLNRANMVIRKSIVSSGGVSGTIADPKMIFKIALDNLASSVILVHNHPSGNIKPSESDIQLTKKMKAGCRVLEIPVIDHLIFTNSHYYSFADEGKL